MPCGGSPYRPVVVLEKGESRSVLRDCAGLEVVERDIPLRFDEAGRLLN